MALKKKGVNTLWPIRNAVKRLLVIAVVSLHNWATPAARNHLFLWFVQIHKREAILMASLTAAQITDLATPNLHNFISTGLTVKAHLNSNKLDHSLHFILHHFTLHHHEQEGSFCHERRSHCCMPSKRLSPYRKRLCRCSSVVYFTDQFVVFLKCFLASIHCLNIFLELYIETGLARGHDTD